MQRHKLWTRDYILLLLTTFFAAITHNIFSAVFPLYIIDIGGDTALAGAMISGLTMAIICTRLLTGILSDRFGVRKLIIVGSILFAINTGAYIFVTSMNGLFVLRVVNGFSQGIYFGASGICIAHFVHKDRLVDGISYFGIAVSLAAAVAPMVGLKIYGLYGAKVLFIGVTLAAIIGIVFTLLMSKKAVEPFPTSEVTKTKLTIHMLFDFSIIVPAMMNLLIMFGNSSVTNFLPTFGVERQITNISLFFLINNVMIILARLFNGKVMSKIGFNKLFISGIVVFFLSFIVVAFSYSIMPIVVAAILGGLGIGICSPLLNTAIFAISQPEKKGVVSSTFALMSDLGNGLGAFVWGNLSLSSGYTTTYLLSSVCLLITFIIFMTKLMPKLSEKQPFAQATLTESVSDNL